MKKFFCIFLYIIIQILCKEKVKKIGLSMPSDTLPRWEIEGRELKEKLLSEGYLVDLQIAKNYSLEMQRSHIENMITGGCSIIVISAISSDALSSVLSQAKKKGIKIISYDRLILNSEDISYYATFDSYKVGVDQGNFLKEKLNLTSGNIKTIEFFTGDKGDNNINYLFGGMMSVLKPYINNRTLNCVSNQTHIYQAATEGWSKDNGEKRMSELLNAYYKNTRLDAVYSSNDSVAKGIIEALKEFGYEINDTFPIVTGEDLDNANIINLCDGSQAMTLYKDTSILVDRVVKMIKSILNGEEPEINDEDTFDNGTGVIPTFLCDAVLVTKENITLMRNCTFNNSTNETDTKIYNEDL